MFLISNVISKARPKEMSLSIVPNRPNLSPRVPDLAHATPWPVVVAAYLAAAVDATHTRRAYRRHLHDALTAIGKPTVADLTGADLAAWRGVVIASALA